MTVQNQKRVIGNLLLENIPQVPASLTQKLRLYQESREYSFADWLPDGRGLLVSTRSGESAQLYQLQKAGGHCEQLTYFSEPVSAAIVRPGASPGEALLSKDNGGDEAFQFYLQPLAGGAPTCLTDGISKHGNPVWSPDGRFFLFSSTMRNGRDQDIYRYDLSTKEWQLAFAARGYWYPVAWSPNGQWATVLHYKSAQESALHLLDVDTGELQSVQSGPGISCREGYWSADGGLLYFTSDAENDWRELWTFSPETGQAERLTGDLPWEIERVAVAPTGEEAAFVANVHGYSRLYLYCRSTRSYRAIEQLPGGVIRNMKWHPERPELALTLDLPTLPANVFVLDARNGECTQWTNATTAAAQPSLVPEPELITYPTFDKAGGSPRKIPAFYFRPGQDATAPLPVLIYIHGGPESQFRPGFLPTFQYYMAELGLAVIAPNVRGSSGYGKRYLELDNGYRREDSVRDIGALLDWIGQQPELDTSRVAVMGGSYGGYMVLASMIHYGDRLSCGVDVVGISNFVTFLENTKPYRRDLRRVEYGDERDPDMRRHLEEISPTSHAHRITKPMLIVQGQNDPRVPASEAEQILKAIRSSGGEAWYMLARDEGHGFRKKTNRDAFNQAVALFLQTFLLPSGEKLEIAARQGTVAQG
ncbi:S9 family peptidase [Phaeodactylibacter luteus]|uniref:S9 family peptidase n=1 Tax=Phaeodactylibacter luteus TaxID=1564516 RepID=A0A5C6RP35_9BACT|nr:S9 family peptidase [Phaeodactylibacter luteus]TXB63420.1 S9 family peptidase [Phaeodactylibacter luteus]